MPPPADPLPAAATVAPVLDAATFVQPGDALAPLLAGWLQALQRHGCHPGRALVVADAGSALAAASRRWQPAPGQLLQVGPRAAGLLDKPFSMARIQTRLLQALAPEGAAALHPAAAPCLLLVDMDWLLKAPSAMANGAIWGLIIERLRQAGVHACLSLYHRRHLPERDLLAGLHAHAGVLAPDGCHANPYQLPADLAWHSGSAQVARQRLDHWLARLSPALRTREAPAAAEADAAAAPLSGGESAALLRGALAAADDEGDGPGGAGAPASRQRWKIRCFGSLRVYRVDGQPIAWQGPLARGPAAGPAAQAPDAQTEGSADPVPSPGRAGATRKLRGLFAMLLLAGERGVPAAELVEVLWPGASHPERALNRLHHTVNELRRRLLDGEVDAAGEPAGEPEDGPLADPAAEPAGDHPGGWPRAGAAPGRAPRRAAPRLPPRPAARAHPYLLRQDQRYLLRPPPNSWIDIEEFPQLCRQGGELLREGRPQEALLCFESALQLYTGELFADLPAAITEGGDADWCAATRSWLRELHFKVLGDCARIQREQGHPLQAAAHCQALLQHDPASAFAHAELMRLHAAQGRRDALDRQFQRYRQALAASGHPKTAPIPLMDLYVELMRQPAHAGGVKTPTNAAR